MSGPVRSYASGGQWRVLSGAAPNTTPPSQPAITATNYANQVLAVTLSPPLSNGGSAITGYTVQAVPIGGGVTQTATGATTTLNLTNLVSDTTYTLTAYATNTVGNGAVSTPVSYAVPTATYVKPLAYNTGYPHGLPGDTRTPVTLTTITGAAMETLTATLGDNATISNYDIQGIFDLRNDNITFENCRFTGIPDPGGTRGFPFVIAGGSPQPSIVTFRDCEFAGNGVEQADPDGDLNIGWALATPSNITSQVHIRSDIWGFADGFHAGPNTRYESCYIHDLTYYWGPGGDTHNDGFQYIGESDNFTIVGCNFDLADSVNLSAILQYNSGTYPGFVRTRSTIMHNWFNGGGYYTFSGGPDLSNELFSMVMAHNKFSLNTGASAIWYPWPGWVDGLAQGKLTLIDNTWEQTGTTTYGEQVTAGSLIPTPEL